ncbi:MAG: hypothetical protein GKR94_03015 [Gammaproteobacteria bacterium]|nr:hypothetical protein [Gammaproteobacteria bacterium]
MGKEKKSPPPPSRYNVQITAPADDATVVQNDGTVSVSVVLHPGLAPVHKLKLTLNGSPVGAPQAGTSFILQTGHL